MKKTLTFLFFLMFVTTATTLLKANEQCCPPCPNGVLIGVTADSCGQCIDLSDLIPGCADASNGKCTKCSTGFYLSSGTCIPNPIIPGCTTITNGKCTKCSTGFYLSSGTCTACNITLPGCTACSNASTCTACASGYKLSNKKCVSTAAALAQGKFCNGKKFVTGVSSVAGGATYTYGYAPVFIPNCIKCKLFNQQGCDTCAEGFHIIGPTHSDILNKRDVWDTCSE